MYTTFFLNYKCITKTANIRLASGTSQCFICILNSITWLAFKMRVREDPCPNENFMKINIPDNFRNYISSYPNTKKHHVNPEKSI